MCFIFLQKIYASNLDIRCFVLSLKKCIKKICLAGAEALKAYLNVAYGFEQSTSINFYDIPLVIMKKLAISLDFGKLAKQVRK